MKTLQIFTATLLALNIYSCTGQDNEKPVNMDYESCCGIEPVEFNLGDAYVYVPNVFTPNGDGINDYFVPSYNDSVAGIDAYLIFTPVGDTIVFASAGYDPNNIENTTWTGLNKDGSVYTGPFKYYISAFLQNGDFIKVEGSACRIVCGPDAEVFKTKTGCFYPSQVNNSGHLDPSLPSNESDCFK